MNTKSLLSIVMLFSFTALRPMENVEKKAGGEIKKELCVCCGSEEEDHVKKLREELTAYYYKKLQEGKPKTAVSN